MSLRQKQSVFAKNISLLIIYAYQIGYEITKGEAYRTYDQQLLYFEGYKLVKVGNTLKLAKNSRKSKTMNSYHLKKLAEGISSKIEIVSTETEEGDQFNKLLGMGAILRFQI